MTTQVTLTTSELLSLMHALQGRVIEFERMLKNEKSLSGPCYSKKLVAHYEGEVANAKAVLAKCDLTVLRWDYEPGEQPNFV